MNRMEQLMEKLVAKDNNIACGAMEALIEESEQSDSVYPYMEQFAEMLDGNNSFVRNRGLLLIAHNARWDEDNKIDEIIDSYLKHITDAKPITARQCIKGLVEIAKYKPDLCPDIRKALLKADVSHYADSMQPLVVKDIKEALDCISC